MANLLLDHLIGNLQAFRNSPIALNDEIKLSAKIYTALIKIKKLNSIDQDIAAIESINKFLNEKNIHTQLFETILKPIIAAKIADFYTVQSHRHFEKPLADLSTQPVGYLNHFKAILEELKNQTVILPDTNRHSFWLEIFNSRQSTIVMTPSKPGKYKPYYLLDIRRGGYLYYSSPIAEGQPPEKDNPSKALKKLGFHRDLRTLIMKHASQTPGNIANINTFYYDFFQALRLSATGISLVTREHVTSVTFINPFKANLILTIAAPVYNYIDKATGEPQQKIAEENKFLLEICIMLAIYSENEGKSYQGELEHFSYVTGDPLLQDTIAGINQYQEKTSEVENMDIDPPTTQGDSNSPPKEPLMPRQLQF